MFIYYLNRNTLLLMKDAFGRSANYINSTSLTKSSGKGILRSNKANPFPFTPAHTAKLGPEWRFTARAVLSRPLYVPIKVTWTKLSHYTIPNILCLQRLTIVIRKDLLPSFNIQDSQSSYSCGSKNLKLNSYSVLITNSPGLQSFH
jgi:hypothetical protein